MRARTLTAGGLGYTQLATSCPPALAELRPRVRGYTAAAMTVPATAVREAKPTMVQASPMSVSTLPLLA